MAWMTQHAASLRQGGALVASRIAAYVLRWCVRHKDIAYHAGPANDWTIGIEHNTRSGKHTKDTKLTAAQYLKSAELVLWLCNMLGFAPDRYHISGHSEADPSATHSSCPQRVLNWDLYMSAISDQQEIARGGTPMRLWNDDEI